MQTQLVDQNDLVTFLTWRCPASVHELRPSLIEARLRLMGQDEIARAFAEWFGQFGLTLPAQPLVVGEVTTIRDRGWTVTIRPVETGDGVALEFFASHRMSADTLNRIRPDGTCEELGSCRVFFAIDEPGAEAAYLEHNRRFYQDVERRGLLPPCLAPGDSSSERP